MGNFKLKFRGLGSGKHYFVFQINDDFFLNYPESEIKKGNIEVKVELILSNDGITLFFKLKGSVDVQCDRCLEFFSMPVKYKTELYVEFGDFNSDISDADNSIVISHKENEIVLDKHFYDYIHLSLPVKRIHPEDNNGEPTCNKEMLKTLEILKPKENKNINSQWDKLKDLYN
jgi:uncharacterized metal-binding protein YceD (DUF177 family)